MDSPAEEISKRCFYAEKGVIGCVMIDEQCLDVATEMVKPQDFYNRNAEVIFKAMLTLRERGCPINMATVLTIVGADEFFNQNNGLDYLITSSSEIGHANGIQQYCKIVRSESIHRKLNAFADKIKSNDWSTVEDADSEVARLGDELDLIADVSAVAPWSRFTDIAENVLLDMLSPEPPCYVKTGLCDLDAMLQLKPGTLTILAARPSVGKSALATNILTHIAFQLQLPVTLFSLEMSKAEVVKRIISSESGVNGSAIEKKKLTDAEYSRILEVASKYKDANIFVDDTSGLDISVLRERARRLHRQHGICCLIVDYLQLMMSDTKRITTSNREQEVARISRGLKMIAMDLHIPVIALSQLSRNVESRADKHPILSDLRESGAIEQDADNVLFLHREKEEGKEQYADLDIAKQRSGPTGRIKLYWNGSITKFTCLDDRF